MIAARLRPRRVDDHVPHSTKKLRAAGREPVGHRGAGAPAGLPQQPLLAGQVDEPGVPPIHPPSLASGLILLPAGLIVAGFVNTQHRRRLRLYQYLVGQLVHTRLHCGSAQPMLRCNLGNTTVARHRLRGCLPEPAGGAPPRRHLRHRLGKAVYRTVVLQAAPLDTPHPYSGQPSNKVVPAPRPVLSIMLRQTQR